MLKKVIPFLLITVLVFAVSCNCGDSDEEPTPTPEPTIECNTYYWFDDTTMECAQKEFCGAFMYQGLRTFETLSECEEALAALITPEPTEEPTPTPSPTPSPTTPAGADAVETVLAAIMPNLVVAFSEADSGWQAYTKADTASLGTLWQGGAYYFFTTQSIELNERQTLPMGWSGQPIAWMNNTAPVANALAENVDKVVVIIGWDNTLKEWGVYTGPSVSTLTDIATGQTYYTFTADPENPISISFQTKTR